LKRTTEAITALNKFLDSSPTDAEAWSELSDLYVTNGMYSQGIFALEEVLLITPNAWNVRVDYHFSGESILTEYRFMLDWVKCCSWQLQAKAERISTFQKPCGGSAEVSNYVMTTLGATMG